MNEESASSGDLSNSWCLVTGEAANPAVPPVAPPEADQQPPLLASPASSSDHSDFEIFDEDEGGALPEAPQPPASPAKAEPGAALCPALEAPRPLPRQERRAQERRLLLALRSLRGDGGTGSATPSPIEAPASPAEGHVTVKQEPPRIQIIQHSAEEESLPESDIQIEDAQNMQAGPELIEELMEGDRVRRYQHSPNAHLNARLNGLVMCAVLFVLGLAFGHFLGSTHERFSNHFERVDRNDRIKSIQTELLQCARKYDELELQLNEVKATLVQKEYVDKWESLYQEGEEEKAALTATMNLYKSRYNTQKQLLTQCELRFGELEEKVAKEKLRNLRCQPCPKVDLSCPRELQAVKSSMRALLHLPGPPPLRPLPCDLTALLPSWPALRAFLSNRLHNATALLMEALPAEWAKIHGDLLRSPQRFWSKLTGRKAAKEMRDAPKRREAADAKAGEGKRNHTDLPPQPAKDEEERKVNWFLQRRSSQADEEREAGRRSDTSWFWRDKDSDAATKKEDPTTNGLWYWRRKGKKLPPLSTEYVRPPAKTTMEEQQEPPATRSEDFRKPPAMTMKQQEPLATRSEEFRKPPAKTMKQQEPPATRSEDFQKKPPATKERKPSVTTPAEPQDPPTTRSQKPSMTMPEDTLEPPPSSSDEWPSPGDIDDESEPSDWLEAFMQLREQMMRAQLRIWRSLKQMASRKMGPRQQKPKKRRKKRKRKKKNRKKKQRWSWETEGE